MDKQKTPLMSFWPSINEKIKDQVKIIEYRRTFPKNCTHAYMYISKPVSAICGVVYFGTIHSLESWKKKYKNNVDTLNRILYYESLNYRYGAEIIGYQDIAPISLHELRDNIPNFSPPQSYLFIENNTELETYLKNNVIFVGEKIENKPNNISKNDICISY